MASRAGCYRRDAGGRTRDRLPLACGACLLLAPWGAEQPDQNDSVFLNGLGHCSNLSERMVEAGESQGLLALS
jgi:hypothetical protein